MTNPRNLILSALAAALASTGPAVSDPNAGHDADCPNNPLNQKAPAKEGRFDSALRGKEIREGLVRVLPRIVDGSRVKFTKQHLIDLNAYHNEQDGAIDGLLEKVGDLTGKIAESVSLLDEGTRLMKAAETELSNLRERVADLEADNAEKAAILLDYRRALDVLSAPQDRFLEDGTRLEVPEDYIGSQLQTLAKVAIEG